MFIKHNDTGCAFHKAHHLGRKRYCPSYNFSVITRGRKSSPYYISLFS